MPQRKALVFALSTIAFFLSLACYAIAQTYTDLHDFNCDSEGCHPGAPALLAQGRDGKLYGTTFEGGVNNNCVNCGTVFKATPSGAVAPLYSFDGGVNGDQPTSGLTLASDGNFYGTAHNAGANGWGTIFGITPSGAVKALHAFNLYDGYDPAIPPVQARNGNLYGSTYYGHSYRVTLAGKFTPLPNDLDEDMLIQASDGYLYGAQSSGGQFSYFGFVFRLSLAGAAKTIYNFDGNPYGNPSGPLAQDSDGNFYGTAAGGQYGAGVVFRLTLTPKVALNVLHEFDGSDGSGPAGGVVLASDGNLYGATTGGGANGFGALFKLTKTGTYTLLYSFDGSHGANPAATPMQHTNGVIYGLTDAGGAYNDGGVFYRLDAGLPPFIALPSKYVSGTPGQTIEILGQSFNSTSSVTFGSASAAFKIVSDTYLTAVVPSEGTTGYITVTTGSGTLSTKNKFNVIPIIKTFTPTSGPVGTQVTITGGGFHGATKVTFGGVKASSFSVDSGSQITATVPAGAKVGKITVTTAGGTVTSKGTFTVTP